MGRENGLHEIFARKRPSLFQSSLHTFSLFLRQRNRGLYVYSADARSRRDHELLQRTDLRGQLLHLLRDRGSLALPRLQQEEGFAGIPQNRDRAALQRHHLDHAAAGGNRVHADRLALSRLRADPVVVRVLCAVVQNPVLQIDAALPHQLLIAVDSRICQRYPQNPAGKPHVRPVPLVGLRQRSVHVEIDDDLFKIPLRHLAQQIPDPGGSRHVRAGRPTHHRTDHIVEYTRRLFFHYLSPPQSLK